MQSMLKLTFLTSLLLSSTAALAGPVPLLVESDLPSQTEIRNVLQIELQQNINAIEQSLETPDVEAQFAKAKLERQLSGYVAQATDGLPNYRFKVVISD